MHELARAGMGIIMISDEPEEIVANCNRVVVMHDGEILAKFVEEDLANPDFQDELIEMISNPDYRLESIAPPVTGAFSAIDAIESE
jgi:simple sugar transport system ATP-binding protein